MDVDKTEEPKIKYEVDQKVAVSVKSGKWCLAQIILARDMPGGEDMYLVHFEGFNRRLDSWVSESQISSNISLVNSNSVRSGNRLNSTNSKSSNTPEKKMTRQQKRIYDEIYHVSASIEDMDATTAALERAHEEFTKIKYIEKIEIGYYELETWYFSPYPNEFGKVPKLYICEFCLKYMKLHKSYLEHLANCDFKLDKCIYSKNELNMYQVDGSEQKLFCQNLCLLAKLFLDHKTLYYDVGHFDFFILYETDEYGPHIVGYFSKEKISTEKFNLSCIMVLPPHQKKGYGKFLISFSYELSKVENTTGSPEKPLSDLGKLTYRSYWSWVLLNYLKEAKCKNVTLSELSEKTYFIFDDIIYTLQALGLLRYWKGHYIVCVTPKIVNEYLESGSCKPPRVVADPNYLNYTPRHINQSFSE